MPEKKLIGMVAVVTAIVMFQALATVLIVAFSVKQDGAFDSVKKMDSTVGDVDSHTSTLAGTSRVMDSHLGDMHTTTGHMNDKLTDMHSGAKILSVYEAKIQCNTYWLCKDKEDIFKSTVCDGDIADKNIGCESCQQWASDPSCEKSV